jgi:hypothetical protein
MPAIPVGLCSSCRHVRVIRSDRGSQFYKCQRSLVDPLFPAYPRLPVLSCAAFEPGQDGAEGSSLPSWRRGISAFISERGDTMQGTAGVKVLFIAGFGPIDRDVTESQKLYSDGLGIPFKEDSGGYLHTDALQGAKHFALWPLSQAAQSCFGKDSWPDNIPAPQAWLEFEVDSVEKATAELESRGYQMLIKNKKEPWGQTVSRFTSPEGLLVGVTFTPGMREGK